MENFRCFEKAEFEFGSGMNLILGPNASGKTTILEAIYLLATADSFRAEKITDLIKFNAQHSMINAQLDDNIKLRLFLTSKKHFWVNAVEKKKKDFVGQLLAVLFRPEDIRIVTGSPSRRRRFFDELLVQINWEYHRALRDYEKALKRRNKLLLAIREREAKKSDLFFWSQSLVQNGELLIKSRAELVGFINHFWPSGLRFVYQQNRFILDQNLTKEIEQGITLSGPHRDDFWLEKNGRNLAVFGSRSEQRLAVLNLKLAELEFIEQESARAARLPAGRPILLLDDIFSELDEKFRARVLATLGRQQTIMTTAEPGLVKKEFFEKMRKIRL